ncbi:MAG: short-chain dehydrogenase/reductase [Actinomycetia bacterium]|nr:short-chain dehydrogenase/reductase [Actinomycetes bacterium]
MSRTAVITGGSGGIGLACGEALVARGYDVVLTSRRPEPLEAAAATIGARWVAADAADETSFAAVVDAVERIDLVVHAAGILAGTFVRKETPASFDEVIRANLRSTYVVSHAVLPKMGVGGRIVFISSSSSVQPMRGRTAYSASKAGMNAFAHALAGEVERDGINVHVVIPAPVETPMLEDVTFPMHTLQSKDVVDAVVFLDGLSPSVVLPEIFLRAHDDGPLAPAPTVPKG